MSNDEVVSKQVRRISPGQNPKLMPGYVQRFIPQHGLQRAVCDDITDMTDRFCLKMLEEN